MDDTPQHIKDMVRERMMALSGAERFTMGALMFDAARDMILASLPKDLPPDELKRRLYERIYGEPCPLPACDERPQSCPPDVTES